MKMCGRKYASSQNTRRKMLRNLVTDTTISDLRWSILCNCIAANFLKLMWTKITILYVHTGHVSYLVCLWKLLLSIYSDFCQCYKNAWCTKNVTNFVFFCLDFNILGELHSKQKKAISEVRKSRIACSLFSCWIRAHWSTGPSSQCQLNDTMRLCPFGLWYAANQN